MMIQNLALYRDKYYINVNEESDTIFYFFDYDVRSADINMQFQHFHTFFEMCVLLCPNAIHFIDGIPYEIRMFDIVGISPNRLHKTQYPAGKPCKRLIIQFNLPAQVSGLSNEYEQLMNIFNSEVPIFRFDAELQRRLFGKLNDIYNLAPKQDAMRNIIIHMKFVEFLIPLFLNQRSNIYANQAEMSELEHKIYAIVGYIHAHYREELTLDFLTLCFCISASYLSHKFKQVTGFSVTDYIQMTRLRNVQALLINSQLPITQIAESCGFNYFSQFNRVFRKQISMSPTQYRREKQLHRAVLE